MEYRDEYERHLKDRVMGLLWLQLDLERCSDALARAGEPQVAGDGPPLWRMLNPEDDGGGWQGYLSYIAYEEAEHGEPFLLGVALVNLWGRLEAAIEDIVPLVLRHNPDWVDAKFLKSVEVSAAGIVGPNANPIYHLAEAFRRRVKGVLSGGVTRFESVLKAVGLDGSVPAEARKAIKEMQQVRNVLVHRDGVVDKRMAEQCPWLPWRHEYAVLVTPSS